MVYENIVAAAVTVLSLLLFAVSIHSYRRTGKRKILAISVAFLLFFVKGLVLSVALFYYLSLQTQIVYLATFDLVILLVLFAAISAPPAKVGTGTEVTGTEVTGAEESGDMEQGEMEQIEMLGKDD